MPSPLSQLQEPPGPDRRSDEDLIRLATQHWESSSARAAVSELLSRYQRPIYLWCYRYVRDRERALDLSQDVMTKLWETLPRFHFQSKFSWWAFVVTRNRCLNALKEPRLAHPHEEIGPELAETGLGIDEQLERAENIATVRRVMRDHLDAQERRALALSHFEQMPVDQITLLLELDNVSGARALLQRARRKLRTAMERHAEGEMLS